MNLFFRTRFESKIVLIISGGFLNDKSTSYFEVFCKTKISELNVNEIFLHEIQVAYVLSIIIFK